MGLLRKISFLLLIMSVALVQAQLPHGGKPYSFSTQKSFGEPVIMPAFNMQKAIDESLNTETASGKKPFKFAWNYSLSLTPENSGKWTETIEGTRIWRIHLISHSAKAVSIDFSQFKLKPGCILFIYPPSQELFIGGFNYLNNNQSQSLPTSLIKGAELVVELQVQSGISDYGSLKIGSLAHAYINVLNSESETSLNSGSCNVDINCPEGADWQIIKKAICRITFKVGASTESCTGTLINNTKLDTVPYLLTANHCIRYAYQAGSVIAYFGFEADTCGKKTVSHAFSLAGSTLLATSDSIDFSLLRLSESPTSSYKPYFVGWSLSPIPATSAVCIHHPSNDVKKISFENDPLTSIYQNPIPPDLSWLTNESLPQAFWRVTDWEKGTTEGGSSGSPLFNQNKLLVGNLTGGQANCLNSVNDYYSKFFMGWDYYSDSTKQLKHWLDPENTGVLYLQGFNPFGLPDTSIIDSIVYGPRFSVFPNPTNGITVFETDSLDISGGQLSIYTTTGKKIAQFAIVDDRRLSFDASFLEQGIYILEFRKGNARERKRLIVLNPPR